MDGANKPGQHPNTGATLYVWCTACKLGGQSGQHPGAGPVLQPGAAMPMGQAHQCTGCLRRGTCNGRLPRGGGTSR